MKKLTENLIQQRIRTCTTDLDKVIQINITGRELEDISLLRKMTGVEILSLSVNKISSLADFQNCKNLKELYLRHNNVADINQIFFLQNLPKLQLLMLSENPICEDPLYRMTIIKNIKNLIELDGTLITSEEKKEASKTGKDLVMPFDPIGLKSLNSTSEGTHVQRTPTQSSQTLNLLSNKVIEETEMRSKIKDVNEELSDGLKTDSKIHKMHCNSNEGIDEQGLKTPTICKLCGGKNNKLEKNESQKVLLNPKETVAKLPQSKFGTTKSSESGPKSVCSSYCNTQRTPPKNPNILSAVLNLLKELDYTSLQVVNADVISRLDSFQVDFLFQAKT